MSRHQRRQSGVKDMPEELEAADALLGQADVLLQRHRSEASLITATGEDLAADDLPLLTEVVDDAPDQAVPAGTAPLPRPDPDPAGQRADLDGLIARELEAWLARELPQLLAAELDRLAERVRDQALARMQTTLLPVLSRQISDAVQPQDPA
jgi:hypothetical protein